MDHERPLVFGRTGAFDVTTEHPGRVVITNRTNEWISFVILVVPSFVAGAAVFPWGRFLREVRGRPDGWLRAGQAIVHKLQQQLLDPPKDPSEDP